MLCLSFKLCTTVQYSIINGVISYQPYEICSDTLFPLSATLAMLTILKLSVRFCRKCLNVRQKHLHRTCMCMQERNTSLHRTTTNAGPKTEKKGPGTLHCMKQAIHEDVRHCFGKTHPSTLIPSALQSVNQTPQHRKVELHYRGKRHGCFQFISLLHPAE